MSKKIIKYDQNNYELLYNHEEIIKKIRHLSQSLNDLYKDKKVLFIGILDGSVPFLEELLKTINFEYNVDFIRIKSYDGLERKKIKFIKKIKKEILINKNIILIDDIVDSGFTVNYFKEKIKDIEINDIKVVSLLIKEKSEQYVDMYGFIIENKYVIGYGMDINNLFRDLKDIYIRVDWLCQKDQIKN